MSFLGCALKPNKPQKVSVPSAEMWHLSQVALHEPTKGGKNYVQVDVKGVTYTVACLEKDKAEHNSVDLFFGPEDATFVNKGPCEVHLLGYLEPKEGKDDEEEVAAPAAKAAKVAKTASPKVAPKAEAKAAAKASPKAEAKAEPKAEAKAKASPKAEPKAAAKAEAKKAGGKEEDDDEDDEDMEGDEESAAEESEEEPAAKKGGAKTAEKRKADQPAAASPDAKKGKPEAKAAASPKAAAASPEAEYVKSLVDYLKANGKTEVSRLGSAVKKPAGVAKLKSIFSNHADKFKVDGQHVELKK